MKYRDNLNKVKPFKMFNWFDIRNRVKACEELIKQHEKSVDLALNAKLGCEDQIDKWKRMMVDNPEVDYNTEIENFDLIRQYYELNGKYLLLNLDFLVAFKYLLKAKTDWEYRFFARRSFTLMHETRTGFLGKLGGYKSLLEGKIPESTFNAYMLCLKDFHKFFETHDKYFKTVRNKTEAHKGDVFDIQYASISDISVQESAILIQGFHIYLANLFMVLHVVLYGVNTYTNKQLSECIKSKLTENK